MRALRLEPLPNSIKRAAGRKQRGDRRRIVLQKAELAACRIIFRQLGDAIEQRGAGQIIEIFRRQTFRLGAEAGDDVGGEGSRRLDRLRRAKGGLDVHVMAMLSVGIPASRSPAELPARRRIEEIAIARRANARPASPAKSRAAPSG